MAVGVGDRTTRVLAGGRVAEGVNVGVAVSVVVSGGRWVAVAVAVASGGAIGKVGVDDGVVEAPVTGSIGVEDGGRVAVDPGESRATCRRG